MIPAPRLPSPSQSVGWAIARLQSLGILPPMDVTLPVDQLETDQLLRLIVSQLQQQQETLDHLTQTLEAAPMADLAQSVEELQAAVDNVANRFNEQVAPLQEALAEAQAQVSQMQIEDVAQQEALNTALQNASDAAAAIQGQVEELNNIGSGSGSGGGDGTTEPTDPDTGDGTETGATGPTAPEGGDTAGGEETGPTGPEAPPEQP